MLVFLHPSCDGRTGASDDARRNTGRGEKLMADRAFIQQLQGFSLTTAEILYRLPDHPSLLQTYIWQDYDLSPKFPKLQGFLDFWSKNLEGKLFKVRVAHKSLISANELALVNAEFRLN
jgi:uncharacterized protein Usg